VCCKNVNCHVILKHFQIGFKFELRQNPEISLSYFLFSTSKHLLFFVVVKKAIKFKFVKNTKVLHGRKNITNTFCTLFYWLWVRVARILKPIFKNAFFCVGTCKKTGFFFVKIYITLQNNCTVFWRLF